MHTKLTILALLISITAATGALAQACTGFTTDANDFIDIAAIDLLPTQTWGDTQPFVRGGVEYTGGSLLIGTECPGSYGVLALCDFSSPTTGIPAAGSTHERRRGDRRRNRLPGDGPVRDDPLATNHS